MEETVLNCDGKGYIIFKDEFLKIGERMLVFT